MAARVAPHKKIHIVEFIDEIPKSPAGKILRRNPRGPRAADARWRMRIVLAPAFHPRGRRRRVMA
nr:4-coumarate--CoA ligase family protein [Streptomyces sp. S1D4-11]QIY93758.1 4-coumarate--CoA ligase family protein [Streptomyces sp. S1D4-11]